MPPAVLTSTASGASAQALGKRTRSEPSSRLAVRRTRPGAAASERATWPCARLAAKMARFAASDCEGTFQGPFVEVGAGARIDDLAAVHDGEVVAELTGEVEILLHQHDRHFAEAAQI